MSEALHPTEFTVVHEGDVWVATDTETGIASQGDDPNEAVAMATEAVELSQGDHDPAPPEEQEEFRRELGIDEDEPEIDSPSGMP